MNLIGEIDGAVCDIHSGVGGRFQYLGDVTRPASASAADFEQVLSFHIGFCGEIMIHLKCVLLLAYASEARALFPRMGNVAIVHEMPVMRLDFLREDFVGEFGIQPFEPGKTLEYEDDTSDHRCRLAWRDRPDQNNFRAARKHGIPERQISLRSDRETLG